MKSYLLLTLSILLLTTSIDAQNLVERDRKFYPNGINDVWGYTADDKEYAIVGVRNGTAIIDVTNPDTIEQIHFVFGNPCTWRDIKIFGNYAYVTQDCASQTAGLTIINLTNLQDSIVTKPWRTDGTTPNLRNAHNIYIDEFGFAYICGHNFGNGGVLILDLNTDPWNPTVVGSYSDTYVHDLYVRNNIMYTAEYNAGRFSIIDATDKSNLQVLGRNPTPVGASHNIWPSDDGSIVFTTDETTAQNTTITSYDISDLGDIKLLDEYNSDPSATPHNALVLNDFVVASHYSYGVVILDGSVPDKMVEVAHFDTDPDSEGDSYEGCWGVYPYLPSGNILASDQKFGLYVLTPTYKRAIHIRGTVTDALTDVELFNANVNISENSNLSSSTTDLSGKFKQGFAESGSFIVTIELENYQKFEAEYNLDNGDFIDIDVKLYPIFMPSSTVFQDVNINETVTICDPNPNNITIDTTLGCNGITSSAFGEWVLSDVGCIEYTAADQSGNFVDTICIAIINEAGDESNTTEVIISILNNTVTSTQSNVLENGSFSLIQNPVKDILYLKNNLHEYGSFSLEIYDINGSKVLSQQDAGFNDIISLPISHLSKGLYILNLQSSKQNIGFIKFVKE